MLTYLRFRWQRIFRRQSRKFRRSWRQYYRVLRFSFFGKGRQLAMIRRFALSWWLLSFFMLAGLLLQIRAVRSQGMVLQPLQGGTYTEAVVGSIKNINPILPESSASADATRLIFSGLTKFDGNGDMEGDLAQNWNISPDGKTYTFHLRHDVSWHDGVPFTAQDVVFTLAAIQNPDTRSPLSGSWQGVRVGAPDDYTVVFTLPKSYSPFINATTVGILPRHLLENTDPSSLRVSSFNQNPIGTGPFKLDRFDASTGELQLVANHGYYDGRPLLDGVNLRLYDSYAKALDSYTNRQTLGVSRLQPNQVKPAHALGTMKIYDATIPDEVAVFFKTNSPILQDKTIRAALAQATDREAIIRTQFNDQATPLAGPLLGGHLNLAGAPHQASYNLTQANAALDAAGWHINKEGVRVDKTGQKLELLLVTQADSPYSAVATELARQWRQAGVVLNVKQVDASSLQQSYIRTRHYDALLYGINVGADPDVYAYWDSSQIKDPGLNLSNYSSAAADRALESGRLISDSSVRAAKYRAFVQTWVGDTPAVMLYTPTYVYGVDSSVHGVKAHRLINPADRFDDIEHWAVRVRAVPAH